MSSPGCVGALIRDSKNRIFIQLRSGDRRILPGAWDIVGGHIEVGETPRQALEREVCEETGWKLRSVEAVLADWSWEQAGVTCRELDCLIEVTGNLDDPQLEASKHVTHDWFDASNEKFLESFRKNGNGRLGEIVLRASRVILTTHLRLEPVDNWNRSRTALAEFLMAGAYAVEQPGDPGRGRDNMRTGKLVDQHAREWDAGGFSWVVYKRRPDHGNSLEGYGEGHVKDSAIGSVKVSRDAVEDSRRMTLDCLLPGSGSPPVPHVKELISAALTFAFRQPDVEVVRAHADPARSWACAAFEGAGMAPVPAVAGARDSACRYEARRPRPAAGTGDDKIVTGIGQVLAIR